MQQITSSKLKKVGKPNILYKNDNLGINSINTGYFLYFKQGALSTQDFNLSQSLPNRVVNENYNNINNNRSEEHTSELQSH